MARFVETGQVWRSHCTGWRYRVQFVAHGGTVAVRRTLSGAPGPALPADPGDFGPELLWSPETFDSMDRIADAATAK